MRMIRIVMMRVGPDERSNSSSVVEKRGVRRLDAGVTRWMMVMIKMSDEKQTDLTREDFSR